MHKNDFAQLFIMAIVAISVGVWVLAGYGWGLISFGCGCTILGLLLYLDYPIQQNKDLYK